MDIGSNGVVHVAFSNNCVGGDPTGTNHIWYASSSNNWLNVRVDSDATVNWWDDRTNPSIDVDSNNMAHIVWEDQRNTVLSGDPAFHGGTPNRSEIFYATSANGWANVEIALPADTTWPRVKTDPSIIVQNGTVHVSWIQQETDDWVSQGNLFYANSTNWNHATNVTNITDQPLEIDLEMGNEVFCYLRLSRQGMAVDDSGTVHHVVFMGNRHSDFNVYYANKNYLPVPPFLSWPSYNDPVVDISNVMLKWGRGVATIPS